MKKVHSSQILGNPVAREQHACIECSVRSNLFEDGSVCCVFGHCHEPEKAVPEDARKFAMRQDFDRRHGITGDDRGLMAAKVAEGEAAARVERARINERIRLTALGHQPRL